MPSTGCPAADVLGDVGQCQCPAMHFRPPFNLSLSCRIQMLMQGRKECKWGYLQCAEETKQSVANIFDETLSCILLRKPNTNVHPPGGKTCQPPALHPAGSLSMLGALQLLLQASGWGKCSDFTGITTQRVLNPQQGWARPD